jgi:hypothetical protein
MDMFPANSPMASRAWRLCNLYSIIDADGKLRAFEPNWAQKEFYNNLWFCNHVLKARKLGFSTFIELLNLDDLLIEGNLTAGIVDKGMDDAIKKLKMVKCGYENLDNGDIHPDTWKIGRQIKKAKRIVRDAVEELEFSNKSIFYCGVSLRGGTTNRLHVSELGATAIKAPKKAQEIVNGAFNAFTPGNRADIESTHEGGRLGIHYNLLRKCMAHDNAKLTEMDFRFHFFPWWRDPRYSLAQGFELRPEIKDYFERMTRETGVSFTHGQMLWYDRKELVQGHGMKKEFPTTAGEAFEAIADGAIYGRQMADLRAAGRIAQTFGLEANLPIYTFWDIGLSDYTAVWLVQPVGRWFLVLDWFEAEGCPGSAMPDVMQRWERKWAKPIAGHYLPHDAETRDRGSGKSYVTELKTGGLVNIRVVPRTPDVWLGIGYVRDVLPHCWFHRDNCDQPRRHAGEEFASGVACLEGYSKDVSPATGTRLREMPKHDLFSHSSDAFRTFGEAHARGMINAHEETPLARPKTTGGVRR